MSLRRAKPGAMSRTSHVSAETLTSETGIERQTRCCDKNLTLRTRTKTGRSPSSSTPGARMSSRPVQGPCFSVRAGGIRWRAHEGAIYCGVPRRCLYRWPGRFGCTRFGASPPNGF